MKLLRAFEHFLRLVKRAHYLAATPLNVREDSDGVLSVKEVIDSAAVPY